MVMKKIKIDDVVCVILVIQKEIIIYRKRKYIYTQVNSMITVAVAVAIVLCEYQTEVIENVKNTITTTTRTKND